MASISSVTSVVLDLPPCCVEFWPEKENWAVIGTYYLEKTKSTENFDVDGEEQWTEKTIQERSGSLVLLSVEEETLTLLQTLLTPSAILDIHFAPRSHNTPSLLAAATSTGSIALYNLTSQSESNHFIVPLRTIQLFPSSALITSFAFHPTAPSVLACTLSTNSTYLAHIPPSDTPSDSDTAQLLTHDLEAWITEFAPDGSGLFSGSDDAALRYVSLPELDAEEVKRSMHNALQKGAEGRVEWVDTKIHGAGVTAVLPLTDDGVICVTGSYDDCLRVVRVPKAGRRKVLAEENLGGGVWRFSRLGERETERGYEVNLVVCCMYAGARVVRLRRDGSNEDIGWKIEVLAKFEEHKSMNYGCDVLRSKGLVVSTSFYDRFVCLWRLPQDM